MWTPFAAGAGARERCPPSEVYSFRIEREAMDGPTLTVLIISFLATLIRSTFGFGEALVAVPLLALTMPIRVAVPVAVLLSVTVALVVVIQDWRDIQVSSAGWLIFSTLFGIPIGIGLLETSQRNIFKAALGLLIFFFACLSLKKKGLPELKSDSRVALLLCGFLAGIFGGAYGINGPPLVVYGTMRRWSPRNFRATLQGYFLPASLFGIVGFWLSGLWVPEVTHSYLIALAAAIPAIFVGRRLNGRLSGDTYLKYVHCGLAGIGALLVVQALTGSSK